MLMAVRIYSQPINDRYVVEFADKSNISFSIDKPEEFLSSRAIMRRVKQGIPVTNLDLPVCEAYLDSLRNTGAEVINVSKWMNSATVETGDSLAIERITLLPFVKDVKKTYNVKQQKKLLKKEYDSISDIDYEYTALYDSSFYGASFKQISMHNAVVLHEKGFRGEGMLIAVLDAGFYNVDSIHAFDSLFFRNSIIATRDYFEPGSDVYRKDSHGEKVLSVMTALIPNAYVGTAPYADYLLVRTEYAASEYIAEEDSWIAGAEFADSIGADIISSSLGYFTFNDSTQNHTYADLDGNTVKVSIAADIAASRGMIVVCSAGNERHKSWKYIIAPSDADSILAVGAVDTSGTIAYFSSCGPTADGRVKPDVVAIGKDNMLINEIGNIIPANGTSFAAPVISGLTACLWQAFPNLSNMEIINAIKESSNKYYTPDSLYGYGIPDFGKAYSELLKPSSNSVGKYFGDDISNDNCLKSISNSSKPFDSCKIEVFDINGKTVYNALASQSTNIYEFISNKVSQMEKGLYLFKITSSSCSATLKISK